VEKLHGKWRYFSTPIHAIYGWLQVSDVVLNSGGGPLGKYPWLDRHPHVQEGWGDENVIYVANNTLNLARGNKLRGFGVFRKPYQLTALNTLTKSVWHVPEWLHVRSGGVGMSFHPAGRWLSVGEAAQQLFVLWRCQWHAEELLVGPFLAGAENRYDQTRACGTENLWLFGRDANGIDRGIAAAAIALEAHPPHAIAARYRQICGVTNTGRDITAADHTLAGRAGRNDDDAAIPGQSSPTVDYLGAANADCSCRLGFARMADCHAGNQRHRPNPPRLLQKPDHVVLTP
jgi:hypothetical protein